MHCHIDMYDRPEAVLRAIARDKVLTVSVTNLPSHFEEGLPHLAGHRMVRPALGFHPAMLGALDEACIEREIRLFNRLLDLTSYVGEIGLDGRVEHRGSWSSQADLFDRMVACIRRSDRPKVLSLHSTKASEEVLRRLDSLDNSYHVLHWFTGTKPDLAMAIAAGCWFSVNPQMLKSKAGRQRVLAMPRHRVLSESDGPYVTAGSRPATPSDMGEVINGLAALWREPIESANEQLESNLLELVSGLV